MRKVARMLCAHEELLLDWFRAKGEISAAAVERLNNKIRAVTRRSYGFRSYEPGKSRCITHSDVFLNRNQPTDSAEEAFVERTPLASESE
jgi:transposase